MINKMLLSTGLWWLWLSVIVFLLDFITKQFIMVHFLLGESISITSFINFTYVHNVGAAFSFLSNEGKWQRWLFSFIAIIVVLKLLIMMYFTKRQSYLCNIAYAMIIGGALGNLFNRVIYGAVIDFIDFYIYNWHWPTFNIADSSICIGAILVIIERNLLNSQ